MKININALETLCETLCKELEDYSTKREIDKQSLANIHDLASSADKTLDIIDKAIMLEQGYIGYSQADEYSMRSSYNHGNSYTNRGKHFVRGHYSRDGWDMHGNYEARGGYSRESGKTREMLREMLDGADGRERDAIMRCLKEIGD